MSTWRYGWICPRSYFVAAVFLAGASFAVLLAGHSWRASLLRCRRCQGPESAPSVAPIRSSHSSGRMTLEGSFQCVGDVVEWLVGALGRHNISAPFGCRR
jgi:hypothetical protein